MARVARWCGVAFGVTALIVTPLALIRKGFSGFSRLSQLSGLSSSGIGLDITVGRKHLDPVPISAHACPYVRVMHAAANEVQRDKPVPAFDLRVKGDLEHKLNATFPRSRPRFANALATFELAIVISEPHFPDRVRHFLNTTVADVRTGRAVLKTATNRALVMRYSNLYDSGERAFGYAGDLVGHRCGVQLGADNSTMPSLLRPATTSTTPHPPSSGTSSAGSTLFVRR